MPEVSVVASSYNHARFIADMIQSVQEQTFADWELIIVDDGSQDHSRDIIDAYQKSDQRIKALYHDINMGTTKTVNDGVDMATGRYLTFLASDDLFFKNFFEDQLAVISQPECQDSVIVGTGIQIDEWGRELGPVFKEDGLKRHGDVFEDLLQAGRLYISIQAMLMKREHIGDIRWDERLSLLNEYKFALDLAKSHRFYQGNVLAFKHRLHGDNLCLNWDHDLMARERAILGHHYIQSEGNHLSLHTWKCLYEFMISDGMIRDDRALVRELTLQWLLLVPETLHALREALLQSHRDPQITLTFDRDEKRVCSLNIADVGIGLQDVLALSSQASATENQESSVIVDTAGCRRAEDKPLEARLSSSTGSQGKDN